MSPQKLSPDGREKYTHKTANVSWDTYDLLMKKRLPGESMNLVIRRLLGAPIPDPTRGKTRRPIYYDDDYRKEQGE